MPPFTAAAAASAGAGVGAGDGAGRCGLPAVGGNELADSCRKLTADASLATYASVLRRKGMSKKEKEQAKRAVERWVDATMHFRGVNRT